MQENLETLRKLAGLTAEELGKRIGVTKQTIRNLETNTSSMSLVMYIALRSVFELEVEEHPENEALARALDVLLNHAEKLDEKKYRDLKSSFETVAATAAGGISGAALAKVFQGIAGPVIMATGIPLAGVFLGPIGGVVTALWIKKLLGKKND